MSALLPTFAQSHRDIAPLLNRVHHCDALDLLARLPDGSVDLIAVDPPYGLAGRVFEVFHKNYSAVNEIWDYHVPLAWMAECQRVLKPSGSVICFGVRQSIYALASEGLRLGWRLVNDITWYKPDAPPCFTGRQITESTERALWFSPNGKGWKYNLHAAKEMNLGVNLRDVWTGSIDRENKQHPTQKPLWIMERILKLFSDEGDTVLDCFAGSGTTLVAARNLNRRFIGCDLEQKYVDIARRRLAQPYTPDMFATFQGQAVAL